MAEGSSQLAKELKWLRGETASSMLAPRLRPPVSFTHIAKRVEKVLQKRDLARLMVILETHNLKVVDRINTAKLARRLWVDASNQSRSSSNIKPQIQKQKAPLLLGPHLFSAVHSVEESRITKMLPPKSNT
jgi:hypothetical protein